MPTLKQESTVAETPELISQFKSAVNHAALVIIANDQLSPTDPKVAWAKRVLGDAGSVGRADWYASRILAGAVVQNGSTVDALLASGGPIALPDATVIAQVAIWIDRYAALNI